MTLSSIRANVAYARWVGSMVRGARRKVRALPHGAPQRAMWSGLSRGLLDASELPAWTRLWQPVRPIDADHEDDFYRAGRLWGELLATCFRERARAGRPLRGSEAEELVQTFSRYTAELAFPKRGHASLIESAGTADAVDAAHAAAMAAVRRRGSEPDDETQRRMRGWLEARLRRSAEG